MASCEIGDSPSPIMVTRVSRTDDDLISVDITLEPKGGLRIEDYCYGPVVDEFYGEGQDVEHWIELDAAAVNLLLNELISVVPEAPAKTLANILAATYEGDTKALSCIKKLCDKHRVRYEEEYWPF